MVSLETSLAQQEEWQRAAMRLPACMHMRRRRCPFLSPLLHPHPSTHPNQPTKPPHTHTTMLTAGPPPRACAPERPPPPAWPPHLPFPAAAPAASAAAAAGTGPMAGRHRHCPRTGRRPPLLRAPTCRASYARSCDGVCGRCGEWGRVVCLVADQRVVRRVVSSFMHELCSSQEKRGMEGQQTENADTWGRTPALLPRSQNTSRQASKAAHQPRVCPRTRIQGLMKLLIIATARVKSARASCLRSTDQHRQRPLVACKGRANHT